MPTTINADTVTGGAVVTGDTSGVLQLQTGGTTAVSISTGQVVTFTNTPVISGGATVVTTTGTQTLTGKTIDFANNTLTGVASTSTAQTLTNKTINGANNTITNVSLSTGITGTLSAANGGTGQTSLTANNVILGNGTSGVQFVAPGTNGNVLTSNGTSWVSQAAGGGAAPFEAFGSNAGF